MSYFGRKQMCLAVRGVTSIEMRVRCSHRIPKVLFLLHHQQLGYELRSAKLPIDSVGARLGLLFLAVFGRCPLPASKRRRT